MNEPMPDDLAVKLVELAGASPSVEIVGVVFRDWTFRPLANVHPEPRENFSVDPDTLIKLMQEHAEEIIGAYHSHPSGNPQPSDYDCMTWGYPMFRYWTVTLEDVYEWEVADGYATPLDRHGTRGTIGLAYPVLEAPKTVRCGHIPSPRRSDEGCGSEGPRIGGRPGRAGYPVGAAHGGRERYRGGFVPPVE